MSRTGAHRRSLAAIALTRPLVATAGPAALAKGTEVRSSGTCSSGATWKLEAKTDDGRIQVELEADSNRVGQTWSVRLKDNGVLVYSGTAKTGAPSGSFSVGRRIPNRAGTDTVTATATRTATGQTCSARLAFPA